MAGKRIPFDGSEAPVCYMLRTDVLDGSLMPADEAQATAQLGLHREH